MVKISKFDHFNMGMPSGELCIPLALITATVGHYGLCNSTNIELPIYANYSIDERKPKPPKLLIQTLRHDRY